VGGGIATGQSDANGLALNVTIAYNTAPQGAGIITGGGDFELQNVILAKNTGQNCSTAYGGTISSEAGNISSDNTCNLHGPLDRNNLDPKIGQLADNGGPTQTIALEAGSPAIDAGLEFLAPQIDQRADPRGSDGNGDGIPGDDIGAFEVIQTTQSMSLQVTLAPVVTVTPSPNTFTITTASNCRSGPGTVYPILTTVPVGAAPSVVGRNQDDSWYYLYDPGKFLCWIVATNGTLTGDPSGLPALVAPPTPIPTPVPSPTPTKVPACVPGPSHGCP
jgi:hypothetical protein